MITISLSIKEKHRLGVIKKNITREALDNVIFGPRYYLETSIGSMVTEVLDNLYPDPDKEQPEEGEK